MQAMLEEILEKKTGNGVTDNESDMEEEQKKKKLTASSGGSSPK